MQIGDATVGTDYRKASTPATIHEAIGIPVAIAFDSDNLVEVKTVLRNNYPASPLWVFGDDDRAPPFRNPPLPNIGQKKCPKLPKS